MNANAEIIAELRRVLNERDEAREALDLTKRELGRWVDRETKAVRERDELVAQRTRMAEQIATLDRNAETFLDDYGRARRERDEARAEVEQMQNRCAHVHGCLDQALEDRDEARAEVERLRMMLPVHPSSLTDACTDAYSRGAEAMREACAAALMADGLVLSRERAANVVRALPIPEEQ